MSEGAVLVAGGAGYIGSHALLALHEAGRRLVVLDDLSTGRAERIPAGVPLVEGSVADASLVERTMREHGARAVIHFAGSIVAPASLEQPLAYYRNNLAGTVSLLEGAVAAGVSQVLFSSSAAVYAPAVGQALDEAAATGPTTPYGWSKLMAEQVIADAAHAYGFAWTALRYFNVAGADPAGRLAPNTTGAANLISVACEAALGRRADLPVNGEDWPTRDGTGERDLIHVSDLADVHRLALEALEAGGPSGVLNCGYGRGVTVREVADGLSEILGRPLPVRAAPRRAGDIASVIADSAELRRRLGWTPRHDDLDLILRTALDAARRDGEPPKPSFTNVRDERAKDHSPAASPPTERGHSE